LKLIGIHDLRVLLDLGSKVFEQLIIKYVIYARDVTVDKTSNHDRYWTVCNTECATAIKDYLEQRVNDGEGPIKDTSPLIREHRDPNDIFCMPNPMHVNDAAIRYTVRQILKRSGVYSNSGKDVRMSHAFRKNFKTVCEVSGMKSLLRRC
jgi:hypothetical protein